MGPVSAQRMPMSKAPRITWLMTTALTPLLCRSGRTAISSRSTVSFFRKAFSRSTHPVGKSLPLCLRRASAMLGAATPKATISFSSFITKQVSCGLISGANFPA